MKPIKCNFCSKRFFDAKTAELDIVCPRCKKMNQIRIYSQEMLTNGADRRIIKLKLQEATES